MLVEVDPIEHSAKHYFEVDFVEYFVEGFDQESFDLIECFEEEIDLGEGIDLDQVDFVEGAEGGNFLAENSAAAEYPLRFVARLQAVCLYFLERSYPFAVAPLHPRQHRSFCHQILLDQKDRLSLDL